MEPYASNAPMTERWLPNTEWLTQRVMVLPSGTAMSPALVERVCALVARAVEAPA